VAVPMRLLIAAGQAASSVEDLPLGVRELIDAADEVLVIAPELPTRFQWLSSATHKAHMQADERLRTVLGQLEEELGRPVSGSVGADDPIVAFEDALASFPADHILAGLRAAERSGWQERGLLDELLRFGLPVTVFTLPPE
jgi:hypothetical protein